MVTKKKVSRRRSRRSTASQEDAAESAAASEAEVVGTEINATTDAEAPIYSGQSLASPVAPSPAYWHNITEPLLGPGRGSQDQAILQSLGPLAALIGTWASTPANGYCVMPIPEASAANGYILKNFPYYEEISFSAIPGTAANRGGVDEQDCYVLFYEQRVYFASGPQENRLVHAENGSWLHLIKTQQKLGAVGWMPMPTPPAPNPILPQDPASEIIKQMSVPHGNSILAVGGFERLAGAPEIPNVNALPSYQGRVLLPESFVQAYGPDVPSNPNVNPNYFLQQSLALTPETVAETVFIDVTSETAGAGVVNSSYMRSHANVSAYSTQLWLEFLESGVVQLQYSQNITMELTQEEGPAIEFPHITANTLRRIA
jgi:hypothetical protein